MSVTATENENIALVQRGFEAFKAGDMATLSDLFEPDIAWYGPEMGVLKGTYKGRDAVLASFGQVFQETGGTFKSEPQAVAASGDRVFVQSTTSGQRQGRSLDTEDVIVFYVRNGKIKEIRHYVHEHAKSNDFWK
jgi:ketosteroid isomerase-like protein